MLRPIATHWFEVFLPHEDYAAALDALAMTGQVEIEPAGVHGQHLIATHAIIEMAQRFRALESDYGSFWPAPRFRTQTAMSDPRRAMEQALARVEAWLADAQRLINDYHRLDEARREAQFWRDALARLEELGVNLRAMQISTARIEVMICSGVSPEHLPSLEILQFPFEYRGQAYRLLVAPSGHLRNTQVARDPEHCKAWPAWFEGRTSPRNVAAERSDEVNDALEAVSEQLDRLAEVHRLAEARAELQQLAWLADNLRSMRTTRHLIRLGGWSIVPLAEVEQALDGAGVRALVQGGTAPAHMPPPLVLRHRRWLKPFEVFVRALGMPGRDEADPTLILALAVPLLFGFMFGDVGHGLVFLLLGLYLKRRWPVARLLVWGGAASMVFGLLYGSVFTNETWLTPLWLHPMAHPLTLLASSLAIGIGLLSIGLLLNALQSWWARRESPLVWLRELGFIGGYAGVLLAYVNTEGLWLSAVGLVAYLVAVGLGERSLRGLLIGLGELVERLLQLLINTLSFLRVGAFALAHAGLASAVTSLAAAADLLPLQWLILLLGNLLILVIEGLVVSIQTTRLVLFEFFVRFVKGGGRVFRPLSYPPHYQGVQREGQ